MKGTRADKAATSIVVCLHITCNNAASLVPVDVSYYLIPCTDEGSVVHGNRARAGLAFKLAILIQLKAAVDAHCKGGRGGGNQVISRHDSSSLA